MDAPLHLQNSRFFLFLSQWLPTRIIIERSSCIRQVKKKSLKLALGQPRVSSVSGFILAYGGGWPVLSLTISSSRRQCIVGVLIIAEFLRFEPPPSQLAVPYINHWTAPLTRRQVQLAVDNTFEVLLSSLPKHRPLTNVAIHRLVSQPLMYYFIQ